MDIVGGRKCAWVGAKTSLFVIPCATGCRQRSKECVGAVYGCLYAVLGGVVVVDDGEEEEEGVGRGKKELGGDDQESVRWGFGGGTSAYLL